MGYFPSGTRGFAPFDAISRRPKQKKNGATSKTGDSVEGGDLL